VKKLVTIAIPVYKNFDYLPLTLKSVEAQDYDNLDILISDNGQNKPGYVEGIVEQYLARPSRIRRNPATVPIMEHLNQLLAEARGEYFVLLCDDDYLSPNFVTSMVQALEEHPDAALSLSRQMAVDEDEALLWVTSEDMPDIIHSDDFFLAWSEGRYRYCNHITNVMRTAEVREVGGFEPVPGVQADDALEDILIVKLSVGRSVVIRKDCTFYHRVYDTSTGKSLSYKRLAQGKRAFMQALDTHPAIQAYGQREPERWARSKAALYKMLWWSYITRWDRIYRHRLSTSEWLWAIFELPPSTVYYSKLAQVMFHNIRTAGYSALRSLFPLAHQTYRILRYRS
jgi:glycosyltransferase involved in cell wall biosynthesis